jgi:hypothetical protein
MDRDVRFTPVAAKSMQRHEPARGANACADSVGWQNRVVYLRRGGQTITSNPEGKPDHVRPARGTHPTGTGLQPTTVHAICEGGCALPRRCVYGLALASVETREAMIAMMSDLLIGSAAQTSKNCCSKE